MTQTLTVWTVILSIYTLYMLQLHIRMWRYRKRQANYSRNMSVLLQIIEKCKNNGQTEECEILIVLENYLKGTIKHIDTVSTMNVINFLRDNTRDYNTLCAFNDIEDKIKENK